MARSSPPKVGTDGIRGRTNAGVMTAATAMKVGQAAGTYSCAAITATGW
jgi:phosphomannomutase